MRAHTAILSASVAVLAVVASAAGQPATEGLAGAWSFDVIRGRTTPDASGQGADGIVLGGTLVKGVSGCAIEFDGPTTYVKCPHLDGLAPTAALSVEAWVKPVADNLLDFATVVRKEGAYALRFGRNKLGFIIWTEGKTSYLTSAKAEWPAGKWVHLAATCDGARMRLFVDGQEDPASPREFAGAIDPTGSPLCIGAALGHMPFPGVVDEVRCWRRALTAAEVAASHGRGRQALAAQAQITVESRRIGTVETMFRKPRREIRMIEDGFIWIDAEDFTDYGGWLLDTQFVHLMGSGYLIAAGIGKPVADASVSVEVPRAGAYRLWVRARNWVKDHAPGRFQALVDGKASAATLGKAPTEEWVWTPAGEFELDEGPVEIKLHDLTGCYGRCDALILTTDAGYTPPRDVDGVRQERARLTGLSLAPRHVDDFDVIVVGAGAAGCCAALASARLGVKTALIQNRPVLGGNASDECGVPLNGAGSVHPNARETGIVEELGRVKARYGYRKCSEPFRLAAEAEKNLTVFVNRHVFAVEMRDKGAIAAVKAVDTLTGAITVYGGRQFIDCTGDGWVGYFAGAEYRIGREARAEFNESLAPEKADKITMSGCLMGNALGFRAKNVGRPVKYVPPPWAAKLPPHEEFGRRVRYVTGGEWWLEHPGDVDDLWQAEKARDELIKIAFGYWDYIKNHSEMRDQATNCALSHIPIMDAKRESRRLVGDYILTQNDAQAGKVFPDRIAYGGWPLDVHHPRGIFSGKGGPFDCNAHVPIYTIPLRCLYSVNIENLLFAGRDMSVTHIALGTVRVQSTLAACGQAAGTAAAMCVQRNATPRVVGRQYIEELQQTLLKHDQSIPGIANEDPLDLARGARVTASSTASFTEFGQLDVQRDKTHPLNMDRAVMFPTGLTRRLEAVSVLLSSRNDAPTEVTLHVREAAAAGDFSAAADLATAVASVPPKKESWVEFRLNVATASPYLWIWLPHVEGLSWRLMSSAPLGSVRGYGDAAGGAWTQVKGQYYAFSTSPPIATPSTFRPENAVNGWARIIDEEVNMWASDPRQPLPQWLEVELKSPVSMTAVYLTFDTDLNPSHHTVPLPRQCVRDYELSCEVGGQWRTLAGVKGNFQRRRVHRFDQVRTSRLRLTVHATNGDKSARLYEIRAYDE